jgi:hypothetical protein
VAATLVNNPLAPATLANKLAGGQKGTAPPAQVTTAPAGSGGY